MSYQKILAIPVKYIKFTYLLEDMLERVKVESQYRARNIKDQNGVSAAFDDIAISDDESDAVQQFMRDAIKSIGEKVNLLTPGLNLSGTGAIFYDDDGVYFCVVDHEMYNRNILTIIDNAAEKIIESYTLGKWYESVGLSNDVGVKMSEYVYQMSRLTEVIWELRKPDIDTEPDDDSDETTITVVDIITGETIPEGTEKSISLPEGSLITDTNYVVSAYDSTGRAIPDIDSIIVSRDEGSFTIASGIEYASVTFVVIGTATSTQSGNAKTLIVSTTGVAAGVSKVVTHTFGSSIYFVQAILPDGTNVPGFDSIITDRESDLFSFVSGIAYDSITFLLIGQN